MIAADYIAERLVAVGARHVFGVGGANIEDLFAAVQRRRPRIQAVLSKHEHAAGTAADAYARIGRGLGVVMVTSGGGAMNLVHALAEARASGTSVLALVGEPPTDLQGKGAFQDTSGQGNSVDARRVFSAVSVFCERAESAGDVPSQLERALRAAVGESGPAVLLLAKDRQRGEVGHGSVSHLARPIARPQVEPETASIRLAAGVLRARDVVIVAGSAVARAGAQAELSVLAEALGARVAVAPDARDAFDNFSPRFLGVAGAMGHGEVAMALTDASACLVVGTRLPLLARQGLEQLLRAKPLVSLGGERPFGATPESVHVSGSTAPCLRALTRELAAPLPSALPVLCPAAHPDLPAEPAGPLDSPGALALIERALPRGSVVIVDAGNAGASAVHHLRAPPEGHWLLAMGMAGMGYSFGAAVGATLASGQRCTVLAGDGAFFMNGLDVHTAVEHALPITYVVFNNDAHGMCLVRERLLLDEDSDYNAFHRSHIGAGLGAMFPRLPSCDCRTPAELAAALAKASAADGPSLIGVELAGVEVPPFAAFGARAGVPGTVPRGARP